MNDRELFTSDATAVQVDEQDPQQMQVSSSLPLTLIHTANNRHQNPRTLGNWSDKLRYSPFWLLFCCVAANVEVLAHQCC